jgi:hypothetical protein
MIFSSRSSILGAVICFRSTSGKSLMSPSRRPACFNKSSSDNSEFIVKNILLFYLSRNKPSKKLYQVILFLLCKNQFYLVKTSEGMFYSRIENNKNLIKTRHLTLPPLKNSPPFILGQTRKRAGCYALRAPSLVSRPSGNAPFREV